MRINLLTGILSVTALGAAFASQSSQMQMSVKWAEKAVPTNVRNSKSTSAKVLAPGVSLSTAGGIKKLHSTHASFGSNVVMKAGDPGKNAPALPEGYVLFESFEGWDGEDLSWTPEGWTVEMKGNVSVEESWGPAAADPLLPAPSDGDCYFGINYSTEEQDEWLITPEVKLSDDMQLSYWLYLDPVFLYTLDNVDWETMEFIGDKVVAATLQIWVQPEGEEWTMIHDYAEDYLDLTFMELQLLTPAALEKKTESLAEFAGKTVKVAFRYVGSDGNTMFIDAVGIGYPALEDVSYMDPFYTLYWGFERGWNLAGLGAAIAQYPVYAPLTWMNMSYIDGATFTWDYCDPITAEIVTSDNPDELTVTYVPDYSSAETMKNNLFYPPTLKATAPNSTPGSYTAPYVYFQAGGKPERTLNDGTELNVSMLPFSFNNQGITWVTVDDDQIGALAIPVFGHDANTDEYWLNYSLNGEEPMEGDYSKLEGIGNIFMASEAPLVVNGLTVYGWGQIAPDAELTAKIYALNEEMSADFTTFEEIASSTIKGSDIIAEYSDSRGYLALPFDFAAPVVVKATIEHPAFVFMLEGFNSDKVEYFAPLQSDLPDPNYMCLGYILNHIYLSNHIDREAYYSFKPMVYKTGDEYVDLYGAFAIGIEGEYPWLTTDCELINISPDGSKVEVPLGSYYDGSRLTVEAPTGVIATVAGRYDKCVLTVSHDMADVIVEGDIIVKGPGVEISIPVKEVGTGISSIERGDSEVTGIYDLNGNRVADPGKGVYVIRYSDGTVRKSVVK